MPLQVTTRVWESSLGETQENHRNTLSHSLRHRSQLPRPSPWNKTFDSFSRPPRPECCPHPQTRRFWSCLRSWQTTRTPRSSPGGRDTSSFSYSHWGLNGRLFRPLRGTLGTTVLGSLPSPPPMGGKQNHGYLTQTRSCGACTLSCGCRRGRGPLRVVCATSASRRRARSTTTQRCTERCSLGELQLSV
ncbi:uncharacterized protein LOC124171331 isoform X1 [Ischnura elegans]|uniref:uncharacterized protein LOC124171328 isoform X1 n=1 Tax=Ischnura elegans TaxID=197161 RepID=UPI001ED8ADCC|nr:uncharacterized protein LOC124171328 isoform X1 [Ischnura elegans]XP_046406436.1 uncharacterized protein LOC124171331 isoform X1 [Ischnura elegans]